MLLACNKAASCCAACAQLTQVIRLRYTALTLSSPSLLQVREESDVNCQGHSTCHSEAERCTSVCCALEQSEPYQPKINYSSTRRKQGTQSRSFRWEWFSEYNWLTFCVPRGKVFCFYCRFLSLKGVLSFSKKGEATFTTKGFNNWKKAKEKFREHELSQVHCEAMLKYTALQQSSVAVQLSHQVASDQLKRRDALLRQLSSLRYLLRQGLAIRGHVEEDGNLQQLLKCRSEDVPTLEEWLKDSNYKSHDIVNELIQLMAHQLLRRLLDEIRRAEWFALIADETRDMSGREQLGISLRWVDSSYNIYEDLIGLMEVEMTDAATLTSTLKDTLLRCNLQLAQCRGQAYDGASNMAGHLTGVATRIQTEEPRALFVYCMAHCLNLCLQDCARKCHCVRDAMDLSAELASLIRASPKRLALFQRLKDELAPGTPGLKPLCPTRWTVRTGALDAIIKNYTVICSELEQVNSEMYGEPARKASG